MYIYNDLSSIHSGTVLSGMIGIFLWHTFSQSIWHVLAFYVAYFLIAM